MKTLLAIAFLAVTGMAASGQTYTMGTGNCSSPDVRYGQTCNAVISNASVYWAVGFVTGGSTVPASASFYDEHTNKGWSVVLTLASSEDGAYVWSFDGKDASGAEFKGTISGSIVNEKAGKKFVWRFEGGEVNLQ